MKKTTIFICAISLTILSFTSCKTMYIPNAQNVPVLKKAGDVRLNVDYSDAQLAYAVTDNIGIIANGQFNTSEWSISSGSYESKWNRSQYAFELGAGYYKPLSDNFIFETYGGGGMGKSVFNNTETSTNSIDAKKTLEHQLAANQARFFIQPGIAFTIGKFDIALSVRAMGIKFGALDTANYLGVHLSYNDNATASIENDNLAKINKPFYTFIEPALTIRYGMDEIPVFSKTVSAKVFVQALYSSKLNSDPLLYKNLAVNMGVSIGLNMGKGGHGKGDHHSKSSSHHSKSSSHHSNKRR